MKSAPQKYRTTNWKTYNKAFKASGSLLIWLDPTMNWHGHLVKMRAYWRVDKHTKRERDIGRHRDTDAPWVTVPRLKTKWIKAGTAMPPASTNIGSMALRSSPLSHSNVGRFNVFFWPNPAVRLSIAGCRVGKLTDFYDRLSLADRSLIHRGYAIKIALVSRRSKHTNFVTSCIGENLRNLTPT